MARPKIKTPLYTTDLMLEALSLFGLALLFIIPYTYYDQLAEVVPSHFGIDGKPDAWGGKNNIWLLPGIGLFVYVIFTFINRIPEKLNYPVKITAENAKRQYLNATRLNRQMKLLIIGFLAYFMHWQIKIALEKVEGMNPVILFSFVASILFLVGFYIWKSFQLEK